MTIAPAPASPFELLTADAGDELAATALAAAAESSDDQRIGALVIVVHPERDDHRVLAASGVGVLRAAVSVAVASGNDRLWTDAPANDTIEHTARSLPEVIRAAAEAGEIIATHTGTVHVDDRVEAVAIWFESSAGVASMAQRRSTLELLAGAAERDARRSALAIADGTAASLLATVEPIESVSDARRRYFDLDASDLDPLTGLANRDRFEQELESYDSDEAALVIVDLDHFDQVAEAFGTEIANRVLQEATERIVGQLRKSDLVARVDTDTFAALLGDVDRSTALAISKRLLGCFAEPLSTAPEPETITATVSLSHQSGLVDTDEMMESATDAIRSGQRAGGARLVLGS